VTLLRGIGLIAAIELRQRVRGVAWYVLIGVCTGIVLLVTVLLAVTAGATGTGGTWLYSVIVYFVLLVGSLVAPALSGNAVNGDRENGTLATTQVTLVTTPQLVLGKFAAAWVSSLAFLVTATPFLVVSFVLGGVGADTVVVSLLVLVAELGVISGVGVGFSGLLRRPLFSIVLSYLFVAVLSVGTLIAFGIGSAVLQREVTVAPSGQAGSECYTAGYTSFVPATDAVWWMLAANPYVILADAEPSRFGADGQLSSSDTFGVIKLGVRSMQLSPGALVDPDPCDDVDPITPARIISSTTPSWAVGLGIHVALAAAALAGAVATTRAPSRRLARGSRIA
jgi:ABC-type transport system involved in multi-copper enzyme maturation permease subunit